MINIKSAIMQALISDATVKELVGSNIYFAISPSGNTYPRITFYELTNREITKDAKYADIVIVVDIWNKGNTSPIADAVDNVMRGLGFIREYATDMYEEDVAVYHKYLRYRTVKGE